ncbi:MAG: hypothetical protein IKW30_11510 [Lachnospiraceae bacterium]|nr:hypothetical protein [Lachnospiraceae bacterium]
MKCSNCGVENLEGALFCKSCGNKFTKEEQKVETKKTSVLQEMDTYLSETSKMIDLLYEKFEEVKKEFHSKSDINANELLALRNKKEQLEKENKMLKEQTVIQNNRIEELKKQLQSGVTCSKCGKYFKEKVIFCSECGTKLG